MKLIADAYGFDKISSKLNTQGSILGPLLFNYFICDLLYFLEDFDIANYADDSTAYCACKSVEFAVNNLEQLSSILFEWLYNNYMKLNTV